MYNVNLKVIDTFSREATLPFLFNLTSRLWSALWERNLLLNLLKEHILSFGSGNHFGRVLPFREENRKTQKLSSYLKMAEKYELYPCTLNMPTN